MSHLKYTMLGDIAQQLHTSTTNIDQIFGDLVAVSSGDKIS